MECLRIDKEEVHTKGNKLLVSHNHIYIQCINGFVKTNLNHKIFENKMKSRPQLVTEILL